MTVGFVATLRGDPFGLGVLRKVRVEYDAPAADRLVFLVHGYNVTETKAAKSFDPLADELMKHASLKGKVGYFSWPGDSIDPLSSTMSYLWRVKTADECAPRFADYLMSLRTLAGRKPRIVIIAHSLGCRLAIKTAFAAPASLRRRLTIILMAAAFPVVQVDAGLKAAIRMLPKSVVMYSAKDTVLNCVFNLAENARSAGASLWKWRWQEPVGLNGRPESGVWSERDDMHPFDHGDYWKSKIIHKRLRDLLGGQTVRYQIKRTMQSRTIIDRYRERRAIPKRRFGS